MKPARKAGRGAAAASRTKRRAKPWAVPRRAARRAIGAKRRVVVAKRRTGPRPAPAPKPGADVKPAARPPVRPVARPTARTVERDSAIDLLPARRRIAAAARRAAAVQFPAVTMPIAADAPLDIEVQGPGPALETDMIESPLLFVDSMPSQWTRAEAAETPADALASDRPAASAGTRSGDNPGGAPPSGGDAGGMRLETAQALFDVALVRGDFPALHQQARGRPLVYLDNANTTQKPRAVIDAVARFYEHDYANIHRGLYELSERATEAYEAAREKVRQFINAGALSEIIFTRGTTEAINLVAQSFARRRVGPGDEILITAMEHHSNIVPWQMVCEEVGAVLRVVPIFDDGDLDLEAYGQMIGPRTRLVALTHASNALGTINPVREMIDLAHDRAVPVLVDGAQAASHLRLDVRDLDCDFYALSGHKIFGPTGIGVLYGKAAHLDAMPPWQGGGDMIASVTFEKTLYNRPPMKFEAGTPDIAGVIGLGAAIDYLGTLDRDGRAAHEDDLLAYATAGLETVPGLRILGRARRKTAVVSFVLDDIHPHDIGTILDREGIAVRAGHHCAQPLMDRFGVPATARASFAFYNTRDEVDALVAAVRKVLKVFKR